MASSSMNWSQLQTAVTLWFADRAAAEATYGPISTWVVTNAGSGAFPAGHALFNKDEHPSRVMNPTWNMDSPHFDSQCDLSGWDVSGWTRLMWMFNFQPDFNQDLSGWDVRNVRGSEPFFGHDLGVGFSDRNKFLIRSAW